MTDPGQASWVSPTPAGFRRHEATALVGHGDETWRRVAHDVLRWRVKTASGFRVEADGPVAVGQELRVTARMLGLAVVEPVRVVAVVDEPDRVGFAYRALPGHPVRGEEAFIVHRAGDGILFTVRSLTAPAARQPWRALHPLLRVAQAVARRRYLRALR